MLIDVDDPIALAAELLDRARHVLVLSGAGISTDSGIPDFRGPEGVWTKDPDAEMLSSYDRYTGDEGIRRRAWQSRLRSPTWTASPNDGHRALVALDRKGVLDLVVTQNIDRLHQAAGLEPAKVVEIHGNAHEALCLRCGDRRDMVEVLERVRSGEGDPRCEMLVRGARCGGIIKSATISFGQALVAGDLERAEAGARHCDLLLAIGSTLSVYPAAAIVPLAKRSGASVVILNAEATAMDGLADVVINGDITSCLQRLLGTS